MYRNALGAEKHMNDPEAIAKLQAATAGNDREMYKQYRYGLALAAQKFLTTLGWWVDMVTMPGCCAFSQSNDEIDVVQHRGLVCKLSVGASFLCSLWNVSCACSEQ